MTPTQRYELIRPMLDGQKTVQQVHQQTGVPISTLYWILKRFRQEGIQGLQDKTHANHYHPNWLTQEQKNLVIRYKADHPHLTTRQIADALAQEGILCVHDRTVANILHEHGLTTPLFHDQSSQLKNLDQTERIQFLLSLREQGLSRRGDLPTVWYCPFENCIPLLHCPYLLRYILLECMS